MPTYNYIPVGYWRRFKERAWRLFGTKVSKEYREELLQRVALRHGAIRHNRFSRALSACLKDCYEDSFEDLIFGDSKLLKAIE